MFCTKCGAPFTEGAAHCPQCGTSATAPVNQSVPDPQPQSTAKPIPPQGSNDFHRFINFDIMITPMIMKVLYVVVSVAIAVAALVGLFSGGAPMAVISLFGGLFALVFFRLLCEQVILFINIYRELQDIRRNNKLD